MDTNLTTHSESAKAHVSAKGVLKESGLGERLKHARGTLRLSEKDAAQRLHLNPTIIALIENEDFENGPPSTFIRGYIRSYARLLNFPDEEINAAFIELDTHSVQLKPITPPPAIKSVAPHKSYHYIRRTTYLIAAGLIALVTLWWASHPKDQQTKPINALNDIVTPAVTKPTPQPVAPQIKDIPKPAAPTLTIPPAAASVAKPDASPADNKNAATTVNPNDDADKDVTDNNDTTDDNNTVNDTNVYN